MIDEKKLIEKLDYYISQYKQTKKLVERQQKVDEWIPSFKDNLPVIDEEVLVSTDGLVRVYSLIECQGVLYWIDEHGVWQDFKDVEAWMPLPEPYK